MDNARFKVDAGSDSLASLQAYQPVQCYILYAAALNVPGRIVNFFATLVNNSLVVVAEVIL